MHEIGTLSPTLLLISHALKVVVVFTATLLLVALLTLAERRISAFIQDRLGPNRVGPQGILQPIADGIKNFLKEETYPGRASKVFFLLAPALSIGPAFVTFAVVPFAAPLPTPWGLVDMIVADLPIGILYVLAIAGLGVYGIVMAGWSSNNKYAFLGGLRASAQIVSYEIPSVLALLSVVMIVGTLNLQTINEMQAGWFWNWLIFDKFPFVFIAFSIFFVASLAEVNRAPFDIPEAESELVAGYHTEYSGMKFALFFLAEYANMFAVSAVAATLFLGGWNSPFGDFLSGPLWGVFWFVSKGMFFIFIQMWLRWTLPRLRVDQLMYVGWKVLTPFAFVNIIAVGLWLIL